MSRTVSIFAVALLVASAIGFAQEPGAPRPHDAPPPLPPGLEDDLHALRQMVEQQSKQLEALAREVAQMSLQLEGKTGNAPAVHEESTTPEHTEAAPAAEPAEGAASAESPKAEAVSAAGGGPKHTVAKGETLTSIAKHYNVPVADLQKANKIHDERKLQIGQSLNIPTTKTPEPPPDKKENP